MVKLIQNHTLCYRAKNNRPTTNNEDELQPKTNNYPDLTNKLSFFQPSPVTGSILYKYIL
jgi:hypothetical protein